MIVRLTVPLALALALWLGEWPYLAHFDGRVWSAVPRPEPDTDKLLWSATFPRSGSAMAIVGDRLYRADQRGVWTVVPLPLGTDGSPLVPEAVYAPRGRTRSTCTRRAGTG